MKLLTSGYALFFIVNLLWLSSIVCNAEEDETSKGIQFKDDILIGRENLITNGGQWSATTDKYIFLLAVEGATDRYNLGDGFFVGFQWYNDMYDDRDNSINLQLYRLHSSNSSDGPYEGSYILVNETGFIKSKPGFNYYLFNESIRFDTQDTANDSYYIGIMANTLGIVPILTDSTGTTGCSGSSNVVLHSEQTSQPAVGSVIDFTFPGSFSGKSCLSFSLQGIFARTNLASTSYGRCSMHIAPSDNKNNVTSHGDYGVRGFPSSMAGSTVCQIIRAEREDYLIEIVKEQFELSSSFSSIFWSDCSFASSTLQVGDQRTLNDLNFNLWGTYCGTDVFSSEESDNPYVKITLITSTTSYGFEGYQFSIHSKEDHRWIAIVITVVVLIVLIVIIIVIIVCCCKKGCCCAKTPGKVHSQNNQNFAQNTQMNQPHGQPQNRLPPIQMNHTQQGQYGQQNSTIISMGGGASGGAAFVPPPAYNSVVAQDPYGVPPPAVYAEPGQPIPY